jgi:hypothetical protein
LESTVTGMLPALGQSRVGNVCAVGSSERHRPTVGVDQGDLGLTGLGHLFAQGSQLSLALPEDLDLLLELFGAGPGEVSLLLVVLLQLFQVLLDPDFDLLALVLELASGEACLRQTRLRSRALTALNLEPSMAISSPPKRRSFRQ